MHKAFIAIGLLAAVTAAPAAAAESGHDAHHPAPAGANAAGVLSSGEVRKVDRDANKITIRHGPLENLGMPPMTMVFQVNDPALLKQVKAGDKVRFLAEKSGGAFVVTRIEPE